MAQEAPRSESRGRRLRVANEPMVIDAGLESHVSRCLINVLGPYQGSFSELNGELLAGRFSRRPGETMFFTTATATARYPYTEAEVSTRFEALVDRWVRETEHLSDLTEASMHDAYQKIIGIGFPAVRLILQRLAEEVEPWFWALTAITCEDPTTNARTSEEAATAWINWGRSRGLLE